MNHACDDSAINKVNTEEELYSTCNHSTHETNDISRKDDENVSIDIMHHFHHKISLKMNLQEQNTKQKNVEFIVIKILFWIYY